jgi:hypothetical protein
METNIKYEVIDRFFAAQLSANECEATLSALRPQVEEAVEALIREQNLPRNYTGTITYNGIKILVRRPKSYTWEQNTQIQDANLDYYKQQHNMYVQLSEDLKELLRDLRNAQKILAKQIEQKVYLYGFLKGEVTYTKEELAAKLLEAEKKNAALEHRLQTVQQAQTMQIVGGNVTYNDYSTNYNIKK